MAQRGPGAGASVSVAGSITTVQPDENLLKVSAYGEIQTPVEARAAAVLTAAYVASSEVDISKANRISVLMELLTGATGAVDTWLPNFQIEVSDLDAGDAWYYINTQAVSSGDVTNTRATYIPNANANYTVVDTTYKDIVADFTTNPGWERMRISVLESAGPAPTNAGTMTIRVAMRS